MKIVDKRTNRETIFERLNFGDVFEYEGGYFIKVQRFNMDEGSFYNAIYLFDGSHSYFNEDDKVNKLNAELIVNS